MFGHFLPDLIYLFSSPAFTTTATAPRLPASLAREAAAPPRRRKRKWKGYQKQRRERGRRW